MAALHRGAGSKRDSPQDDVPGMSNADTRYLRSEQGFNLERKCSSRQKLKKKTPITALKSIKSISKAYSWYRHLFPVLIRMDLGAECCLVCGLKIIVFLIKVESGKKW